MHQSAINQRRGKEFAEDAIKARIATRGEDGSLVSTTGNTWVGGMAALAAAAMERDQRMVVGGARMNVSANAFTGHALVNSDSSTSDSMGYNRQTNQKGAWATRAAKSILGENASQEQIDNMRNTIMDATDASSFALSKDGAIMGVTSAGAAALTKTLGPDAVSKLDAALVNKDGEEGVAGYTSAIMTGGTAAATAGINAATAHNRTYQKPVTTNDLKSKGGYQDADGEWHDGKGNTVDVDAKGNVLNEDGGIKTREVTERRGAVSHAARKTWGGVKKGIRKGAKSVSDFTLESMGAERLDNPSDSPTDSSKHDNNSGSDSSVDQNGHHKTPPNSNSDPIVTQKSEQGKSYKDVLNDFEEMKNTPSEEFAKKDIKQRVAEARSDLDYDLQEGNIDKKEYAKKSNALNKVESNLDSGKDIGVRDLDNAGVDTDDLVTKQTPTKNGKSFQSVDLESTGKFDKNEAIKELEIMWWE